MILIAWWQVPLLLVRDAAVATGVSISALRGDRGSFRHMDSRTFGKLTTVMIFALLAGRLLWPALTSLHMVLFAISAVLSAAAGTDYSLARHRRTLGRRVASE